MAAARSPCRCFKTRVLHFRLKNTPLKDKKMERERNRPLRIQPCFLHDRSGCSIYYPNPPHGRLFRWIFHLTSRNLRLFPSIPIGICQLISVSAYQRFLLVGTCSSFHQSPKESASSLLFPLINFSY